MDFCTRYSRPEKVLEGPFHEDKVEREGYIPAEVQIRQMIRAGERLGQFRREQFDGILGEDGNLREGYLDIVPMRSGNFDLADATAISRELKERDYGKSKVSAKAVEVVAPDQAKPEE